MKCISPSLQISHIDAYDKKNWLFGLFGYFRLMLFETCCSIVVLVCTIGFGLVFGVWCLDMLSSVAKMFFEEGLFLHIVLVYLFDLCTCYLRHILSVLRLNFRCFVYKHAYMHICQAREIAENFCGHKS